MFARWFGEATASEVPLPEAAALATADRSSGRPSVRTVLLKDWGPNGFVFYTNLNSQKGRELQHNPQAALLVHWKSLGRQVRVSGPVEAVAEAEADAYFASRPRASRLGAWASRQSEPFASGESLEFNVAKAAARFPVGPVPGPHHWGGFRVVPERMEFWSRGAFRLHSRWLYQLTNEGWTQVGLQP